MVGAGGRTLPDAVRHAGGDDGRQRPRRPRGQPLYRPRQARQKQCRAGRQDPQDRGGARLRSRRRPPRRARCSASRAATVSDSDARRAISAPALRPSPRAERSGDPRAQEVPMRAAERPHGSSGPAARARGRPCNGECTKIRTLAEPRERRFTSPGRAPGAPPCPGSAAPAPRPDAGPARPARC